MQMFEINHIATHPKSDLDVYYLIMQHNSATMTSIKLLNTNY